MSTTTGMIQCPRCGESIPAGLSRCDACGAYLVPTPGTPSPQQARPKTPGRPQGNAPRPAGPARSGAMPSSAWAMLLIGLLCGGAVGYALRGSVGPRSDEGMPTGPADIMSGQTGAGMGGGMGGGMGANPGAMPADVANMISGFRQTLAKDPDNVPANIGLGNLFYDSNKWQEAIQHYQKALDKDPKNADVRVDMAICYHNLGQDDRAKQEMERVTREHPEHRNAWLNLGVVSSNTGDRATAIRAWEQYLKLEPSGTHSSAIRAQIEELKRGS